MKKIIFSAIALMAAVVMSAQNKSMVDTVYSISEVEVVDFSRKKVEIGKLDVPIEYLPMTINTVSFKDLEIRGITNIEDAVKFLPGVRMQTSYGAFQTLTVRGFNYTPIMVDGIRDERTMINSYPVADLTDIESMELLKGPASVLYGQSVIGGVLNIVRKSPTPYNVVNARMAYGSWENKQATMDFGGKLYKSVNYRALLNYADQNGWRDNGNKRFSGYFALASKIDATSNIDVRGGFNRDWYGTEIGLPPNITNDVYSKDGTLFLQKGQMQSGLNRESRYNSQSDFFQNYGWNVTMKYDKKFGDNLKLQNYASYYDDDINYFGTESLKYLESNDAIYDHFYLTKNKAGDEIRKYICLDTVYLASPLRFSHMAKTFSNQFDLSGSFYTGSIKHNFIGGYTFSQMNRNSYTGYNLAPVNDPLNSKYDVYGPGLYSHLAVNNPQSMGYMNTSFSKANITKSYMHSIYFQDLVELDDKWKVMLAGRYDFFKYMRATAPTYDGERQYHRSEQTAYSINNTSSFTYRAGVVYIPTKDLSLYGSMASFFNPYRDFYAENVIYVDANGNRFFPTAGKEIFKPQTGYQGELGVRYNLGKYAQATGSVFYIIKNNEKKTLKTGVVDEDGITKSVVGQVGSSESKGFDLDITVFPAQGLNVMLGYAYTDATIRDLKTNEYMETETQKGNMLTGVPKNTFFAAANYLIQKGVFKNLGFVATASSMDKVYRNTDNTSEYPSYWLVDMGVSYKLKNNVRLSANVNNVFDKEYFNQSLGSQMVPSMPRNFLLTMAYSLR
ncbi:TonB-dependent siderophore receptor [Dysgonomonas sp. HDW5A]|uniref:TonB-dependent receptor n=1 Tax=Dysgonomonas sp. HDW5A TaxID=2714926 RepID=UPI00140C10E3|nr:TonB-dependent siderophore receptor [Dysgonomonas sp. HDW5A]QIK60380.1 TonB-dependent siderophore receptor [Dysgonomonas sp. HDW5A]